MYLEVGKFEMSPSGAWPFPTLHHEQTSRDETDTQSIHPRDPGFSYTSLGEVT